MNSGNANTCNDNGIEIAEKACELVAVCGEINVDIPNEILFLNNIISKFYFQTCVANGTDIGKLCGDKRR